MLHVVLFQPEIPQNTGNIGRTCALSCSRLHLIHPLGFEVSDRQLKRSGMDYWAHLDVREHSNWDSFITSSCGPKRLFFFTTKSANSFWDAEFEDGDGLVFGQEGAGLPQWLHQRALGRRVCVPQYDDTLRSHNLSTCVGIALYEALRQIHFVKY